MLCLLLPASELFSSRFTLRERCPYSEFFLSVFSRIRTEYGEILRISQFSVRMRENNDQMNSEYGLFSRSVISGIPKNSDLKISYLKSPRFWRILLQLNQLKIIP